MRVVILAGGRGMRLNEETEFRPKPLVTVGGTPILGHIQKLFEPINPEFVICGGYRYELIRDWAQDSLVIDTGLETQTAGRLLKVRDLLTEDMFCLTYGDGLANVDVAGLVRFHHSHGKLCTVTAVHPPSRFGALDIGPSNEVRSFAEKPPEDHRYINGGFFVCSKAVLDYIEDEESSWEENVLPRLASDQELMAYRHDGFFQCMDTMKDKLYLDSLWNSGRAPW